MHRILYVNPAFEQAIGREAARLVGRAAAEAFPRQAVAGRVPLLDKVRGTGRPVCRSAVPLRLRPDELRYWDLEVSPLRPEHGPNHAAPGALLVQLRDVTDRCRALREGEAARARLDALFAFAPEGLLIAEGRRARARRISAHGLTMAGLREGD